LPVFAVNVLAFGDSNSAASLIYVVQITWLDAELGYRVFEQLKLAAQSLRLLGKLALHLYWFAAQSLILWVPLEPALRLLLA
jgi:hypothetical protein